jgi:hypothetical protein
MSYRFLAALLFVLSPAVASAAIAPETLSPAAAQDFQVLVNTQVYAPGAVSYEGRTPGEVLALGRLMKDPHALDGLLTILDQGTLPAQLLALNGLYLLGYEGFDLLALQFEGLHTLVKAQRGCLGFSQPFSELLSQVRSGQDPKHLAYVLGLPDASSPAK